MCCDFSPSFRTIFQLPQFCFVKYFITAPSQTHVLTQDEIWLRLHEEGEIGGFQHRNTATPQHRNTAKSIAEHRITKRKVDGTPSAQYIVLATPRLVLVERLS